MIALRALGWGGAIACALAFNVLAFRDMVAPEARASVEIGDPVSPLITPKAEDVHLLAATMWGEARSEGEDGMRAVAHVMVNRVGPRFGENLQTVILAPKQFSVWNVGDPNRPLVRNPERYAKSKEDRATWAAAQRIAYEVLSGASADPTNGSLFYHTRAIRPSWSRYGQGTHVIGAHIFYRDVPNQRARVRYISAAGAAAAMARPDTQRAAAPARRRGPRAGRVNGVIQYAPATSARQEIPPPSTTISVSPDAVIPETSL